MGTPMSARLAPNHMAQSKSKRFRSWQWQSQTKKRQDKTTPSTISYDIEISKGIATVVPVPIVKEVLELGLTILVTCESLNDIKEQIVILKTRIAEFLLVVTKAASDERPQSVSPKLTEELTGLKLCFTTILKKLEEISAQNALLATLLPQANKKVNDGFATTFHDGIDRFQTLHGVRSVRDLEEIRLQLENLYGLTKIMTTDVEGIKQDVKEVKSSVDEIMAILNHIPNNVGLSTISIPQVPKPFVGRAALVQRLVSKLLDNDRLPGRVCILGPGGMGKTTVAAAILAHDMIKGSFAAHNQHWVPCIGANTLPNFIALLSHSFGLTVQSGAKAMRSLMGTLQATQERHLIVFDNFETIWHPVDGSQRVVKGILEAFDAIHQLSILVTMRSELLPLPHWSAERLFQFDPEDSRKLYRTINDEGETTADHGELDSLLGALGHLPLAVTLMATRAKTSLSTTPSELLAEWIETGTSMLSTVEGGIDYSIQLSLDSKFVRESPDAIHLLQVLSMLPAGIDKDALRIWYPNWRTEGLDTLRNAALVQTVTTLIDGVRTRHISVLPVVQRYMNHGNRIPASVVEQVRHLSQHKVALEDAARPRVQGGLCDSPYPRSERTRIAL